jgi:hypothetical protein
LLVGVYYDPTGDAELPGEASARRKARAVGQGSVLDACTQSSLQLVAQRLAAGAVELDQ